MWITILPDENKWVKYIKEYCHTGDNEKDHRESDRAIKLFLLSLWYKKILEEWGKVNKYYS